MRVGGGHVRPRRALTTVVLIASAGLAISGCATHSETHETEKDTSARAILDEKSGQIILPLTEYDPLADWRQKAILDQVQRAGTAACMRVRGMAYSAASVSESADSQVGDRQYGLWDVERARKYGYETGPDPVEDAVQADRAAGGAAWEHAEEDCLSHLPAEVRRLYPSDKELNDSLVPRLRTDAYNAASDDPGWATAREKWWSCLRAAGLDPDPSADKWISRQGETALSHVSAEGKILDQEEAIRVAHSEARCNAETGLARTLGNLEAAYQAPLVAKNQAALNRVKTANQKRLSAARAYLANHG